MLPERQGDEPCFSELVVHFLERLLQMSVDLAAFGLGPSVRPTSTASEPVGLLTLVGRHLRGVGLRLDEAYTQPTLISRKTLAFLEAPDGRAVVASVWCSRRLVWEIGEGGLASGEAVLEEGHLPLGVLAGLEGELAVLPGPLDLRELFGEEILYGGEDYRTEGRVPEPVRRPILRDKVQGLGRLVRRRCAA